METLFWIWLAAGGVFLILELATPTMIFICFVVGAIVAAIFAQVWPEYYYWQIAIFAVLSSSLIPLTRRFARKISVASPELSSVDRMLGKVALVTERIDPDLGGKIRFEGELWQARADHPIEVDTKVKVKSVSGTRVFVEPLD